MDNQNRIEWIERYLQNELKEEELHQFELHMQTDDSFQKEVNVQRAILLSLNKVGRSATRKQIKEIQERINIPWPPRDIQQDKLEAHSNTIEFPKHSKVKMFPYYAVAATITLLLIASVVGYYLYKANPVTPATPITVQNDPEASKSQVSQVAIIPLHRIGGSKNLGFGGAGKKDTTIAVLIYQDEKRVKSYQFDDTLRIYGSFSADQLSLQLDIKTGQYTLQEGAIFYPLQRYQPKKFLQTQ